MQRRLWVEEQAAILVEEDRAEGKAVFSWVLCKVEGLGQHGVDNHIRALVVCPCTLCHHYLRRLFWCRFEPWWAAVG